MAYVFSASGKPPELHSLVSPFDPEYAGYARRITETSQAGLALVRQRGWSDQRRNPLYIEEQRLFSHRMVLLVIDQLQRPFCMARDCLTYGSEALSSLKRRSIATMPRMMETLAFVAAKVDRVILQHFSSASRVLGSILMPYVDAVFPVSLVHGSRAWTLLPLFIEKALGALAFFSATSTISREDGAKQERVSRIVKKLQTQAELNGALSRGKQFNFDMSVLRSRTWNAFATGGGSMAIYEGLIDAIDEAFNKATIVGRTFSSQPCEIELLTGDKIVVDLAAVTPDDVLAAVIAHEMGHVYSRHSNTGLCASVFSEVLIWAIEVVGFVLLDRLFFFKEFTEEQIKAIKACDFEADCLRGVDRRKVNNADAKNKILNQGKRVALHALGFLRKLAALAISRANEYEADLLSVHLLHENGYNPLGAIFVQKLLHQDQEESTVSWFQSDLLRTHPEGIYRQKALMGAIYKLGALKQEGGASYDKTKGDLQRRFSMRAFKGRRPYLVDGGSDATLGAHHSFAQAVSA